MTREEAIERIKEEWPPSMADGIITALSSKDEAPLPDNPQVAYFEERVRATRDEISRVHGHGAADLIEFLERLRSEGKSINDVIAEAQEHRPRPAPIEVVLSTLRGKAHDVLRLLNWPFVVMVPGLERALEELHMAIMTGVIEQAPVQPVANAFPTIEDDAPKTE